MKIKSKKITDGVLAIMIDGSWDLGMTFVRIQEFYESPEFKGKYFTLEEYMDYWVANQGKGVFNYPTKWSGYNFPGEVFLDWMATFKDVRSKEKILIDEIFSAYKGDFKAVRNTYIIGLNGKEESSRKNDIAMHEVAHYLYRTSEKYKKSCDKMIAEMKRTKIGKHYSSEIEKWLIKIGYHKDVINDEIQAYWSVLSDNDRKTQGKVKCIMQFEKHLKGFIKKNKIKIGKL